jgi:hypothetical protein
MNKCNALVLGTRRINHYTEFSIDPNNWEITGICNRCSRTVKV